MFTKPQKTHATTALTQQFSSPYIFQKTLAGDSYGGLRMSAFHLPSGYLRICLYTVALETPTNLDMLSPLIPMPYKALMNISFPQLTFFLLSLERNIIVSLFLSTFPSFNEDNLVWSSFLTLIIGIWFSFLNHTNCWLSIYIFWT